MMVTKAEALLIKAATGYGSSNAPTVHFVGGRHNLALQRTREAPSAHGMCAWLGRRAFEMGR
jgi:hypothetical protein